MRRKKTIDEIKAEYKQALEDSTDSEARAAIARELRADLANALTMGISTERLETICAAEREGRCVVLPCNVGDTVHYIADDGSDSGIKFEAQITGYQEGVCEPLTMVCVYGDGAVDTFEASEIGKTVFLTRADAEKAMEGKDGK